MSASGDHSSIGISGIGVIEVCTAVDRDIVVDLMASQESEVSVVSTENVITIVVLVIGTGSGSEVDKTITVSGTMEGDIAGVTGIELTKRLNRCLEYDRNITVSGILFHAIGIISALEGQIAVDTAQDVAACPVVGHIKEIVLDIIGIGIDAADHTGTSDVSGNGDFSGTVEIFGKFKFPDGSAGSGVGFQTGVFSAEHLTAEAAAVNHTGLNVRSADRFGPEHTGSPSPTVIRIGFVDSGGIVVVHRTAVIIKRIKICADRIFQLAKTISSTIEDPETASCDRTGTEMSVAVDSHITECKVFITCRAQIVIDTAVDIRSIDRIADCAACAHKDITAVGHISFIVVVEISGIIGAVDIQLDRLAVFNVCIRQIIGGKFGKLIDGQVTGNSRDAG